MAKSRRAHKAPTPFSMKNTRQQILKSAIQYVISGRPNPPINTIGNLHLPAGSGEANRCKEIQKIISGYAARRLSRPLSFAVFGPPGSGKSFSVRQVVKAAGCEEPFLINLSQLSSPRELAEHVKGYLFPDERPRPGRTNHCGHRLSSSTNSMLPSTENPLDGFGGFCPQCRMASSSWTPR